MKKTISCILALCLIMIVIPVGVLDFPVKSAQIGDYTYKVSDDKVTITKVDRSVSGDVSIPSSLGGYTVVAISDSAFSNCKSITSIVIPDSVKSIGGYAFAGCSSLSSIVIKEGVESIGEAAFYGCSGLENITIPDSVTSMGDKTFEVCEKIKSITIGSGVKKLEESFFVRSDNIECINVSKNNRAYCSENGVLFSKDKKTLIFYPRGKKDKAYAIPDGVETIGKKAFHFAVSLESITIPNSVKTLSELAFMDCRTLKKVTIPKSVKDMGRGVFYLCDLLETVVIEDGVKSIGEEAFDFCSNLTNVSIPNSVQSIGSGAFSYCSSLVEITIPDGVKKIENNTFNMCKSLERITIPDSVESIAEGAFRECSSLKEVLYMGSQTEKIKIETAPSGGSFGIEPIECKSEKDHKYYTKLVSRATLSKNGTTQEICSRCRKVKSTAEIYKVSRIHIKTPSVAYNGKLQKPKIVVKDSEGTALTSDNYIIVYPFGLKEAGTYNIKVILKGNYSGEKNLTYKIRPSKLSSNTENSSSKLAQTISSDVTSVQEHESVSSENKQVVSSNVASSETESGVSSENKQVVSSNVASSETESVVSAEPENEEPSDAVPKGRPEILIIVIAVVALILGGLAVSVLVYVMKHKK